MNKFQVGDRVMLVSDRYDESDSNPRNVTGTIESIMDYMLPDIYNVDWDNKAHNTSYCEKDLEFAIVSKPKIKYTGGF